MELLRYFKPNKPGNRKMIKKTDFVELFKAKSQSLRLIYEFNRIPAGYAHSSWIEQVVPFNLFRRIQKSRRGILKLSYLLLKHYNLDQTFHYDFFDSKYRLALLPADVLRTMTFYGGIALNHKEVRSVIDKKEKRAMIDGIGEQGYRFACTHAPLIIGNLENKYKLKFSLDHFSNVIQECGINLFLSAFSNDPEALYKRILLKFQKDIAQESFSRDTANDSLKISSFFIRIMRQVVDRRWQQFVL
jgi:hypothetical protein